MSNIELLRKFNDKFGYLARTFYDKVICIKEILIILDALEFCSRGHGNPLIPLRIFRHSVYKYKGQIYSEDDKLFTHNLIMKEIFSALDAIKNDIKIIKIDMAEIGEKIDCAKNAWEGANSTIKKDLWSTLQLMIKLSEKIDLG